MKLNIMTYNIASGRDYSCDSTIDAYGGANVDLEKSAKVIKDISPDLCGINEINSYIPEYVERLIGTTALNQTAYLSEYTGLENSYFAKAISIEGRGEYGNAMLSKHAILSSETIIIPDPEIKDEIGKSYETRCISKTVLDIAGGITVLQVHMGLAIAEAQNAVVELCRVIDEISTPIILMGDFNMCPSNFLLNMLRERLVEITPDGEGYIHSFPSWTHEANLPERLKKTPYCKIDYIFASKHFKKISCEIPDIRVSDHKPMTATLEI